MMTLTSKYPKDAFKPITYLDYEFVSTLPGDEATTLLETILKESHTTEKVYKNSKHTFLSKISTKTHSNMMFKVPKQRNARAWERFLTLFRPNESFRAYESMLIVQSLGIKGTKPLLAVHQKKLGMTIKSFFIYEFVEGSSTTISDLDNVVQTLKLMHKAEYVRSDPKLDNFISNESEIYQIDFRLKKVKVFVKLRCLMNLCRLFHRISSNKSEFQRYVNKGLLYDFAWWLQTIRHQARTYRRKFKETKPLKDTNKLVISKL